MDLAHRLRTDLLRARDLHLVCGFDGFVDEVTAVVASRQDATTYAAVPTITDFATLVGAAAGKSMCREIVIEHADPGGCAVNLGDGLAALGVQVHCFATLGEPVHPCFQPVLERFTTARSWCGVVGRTLALEFADGKLLLPSVSAFARVTPDAVARELADGAYAKSCARAGVIALTDWSLYPHMTAVWDLLHRQVFRSLTHRPVLHVDLVDPAGRTDDDVRGMLRQLCAFGDCLRVSLGLNRNEARRMATVLGLVAEGDDQVAMSALAPRLRATIGIDEVVIHAHRFALAAHAAGVDAVLTPYTAHPAKSTGAGDRFNAGWCLGHLLGYGPTGRLCLACSIPGYFVRHARSPGAAELADFVAANLLESP